MEIEKYGEVIEHPNGDIELRDWELSNFMWPLTASDTETFTEAIREVKESNETRRS